MTFWDFTPFLFLSLNITVIFGIMKLLITCSVSLELLQSSFLSFSITSKNCFNLVQTSILIKFLRIFYRFSLLLSHLRVSTSFAPSGYLLQQEIKIACIWGCSSTWTIESNYIWTGGTTSSLMSGTWTFLPVTPIS